LWSVFDRLTAFDLNIKPQPQLAESWDINAGYTQFTLKLRKGVQFHTGREFTSDDVKYNLLRVRDPKVGGGQYAGQSNWFTTIDLPDKNTVVLKSDAPRLAIFDFFQNFNILDRVTLEGPEAKSKAVGTGPFSFVEWAQGDHWLFAKNTNHWQSNRVYLDGIRVNVFRDPTAMVTQLEAGGIDTAETPPLQDFARLKADPGKYQALVHPNLSRFYDLAVNMATPAFSDKRVRQALNYAVDRQRYVDTVLLGLSRPQSLFWTRTSLAYEPQKEIQFDPDKAASLLKSAGVSNLSIDLVGFNQYPELSAFNQLYQADLAKIGVTLNIRVLDPGAAFPLIHDGTYSGMYQADGGVLNEPSYLYIQNLAFTPDKNNSNYHNDHYAQLVNSALGEPDDARRKQIYSQLNDLILDESFVWATAAVPLRIAARASVRNIVADAYDTFNIAGAWLA
jgi:peptide/nickel transport system substrate-binding protein